MLAGTVPGLPREPSLKILKIQLYDGLYITEPVDIYQLKSKIEETLKLRSR